MKMRIWCVVASSVAFAACMPELGVDMSSIASRQPMVVEVRPGNDETVPGDADVSLTFSMPLDPATVAASSLAILENPAVDDVSVIAERLDDGAMTPVAGDYVVSDDGTQVTFRATSPYQIGCRYAIVATNRLLSDEHVPFSQTPGEEPSPFMSLFSVDGSAYASASGDAGAAGEGGSPAAPVRPAWLMISEILYDVPGSDTDGDVFIELAGEAGTEISAYVIAFVNGADGKVYDTVTMPAGTIIPDDGIVVIADAITGSPGSSRVDGADYVINFDPQNSPDAVQLIDDRGALVDALGYGSPLVLVADNGLECYEGTPADDAAAGMSLARVDTFDTNDNSLDFVVLPTPSPGMVEETGR